MTMRFLFSATVLVAPVVATVVSPSITPSITSAAEVVAFWGFTDDYDFSANADQNRFDFAPDVDGTAAGNVNLQAYIGAAGELDSNGGGGKRGYTSPTSGVTYDASRTLKWNDLRGGGDDFSIGGTSSFLVDKNDGAGPTADDFGNDALMYLTFDASEFADLQVRFGIEGTPGVLPESFDVFYRTGGSGTWFREVSQNNIPLTFQDYDPIDVENQFADSGVISLASSLNGQSTVELIINDFAEFGNGEMEIDNIEIIGTRIVAIPEPGSVAALALIGIGLVAYRRRQRG